MQRVQTLEQARQELEVQCVVIEVIILIQCYRWVIPDSKYASSDLLS